jgi:hypothetical protein
VIADDVRRFLLSSIPSVPHLEALLLAQREAHVEWTVQSMARRLYTNERTAREVLEDLAEAGFLVKHTEAPPAYRYGPPSPAQREIVERVAAAYSENLVEMAGLIHAKAAQLFADAFRLRKE